LVFFVNKQSCLEHIKISGIVDKVISENNSEEVKKKVEGLVFDQLNKIGDIEIYQNSQLLRDKIGGAEREI